MLGDIYATEFYPEMLLGRWADHSSAPLITFFGMKCGRVVFTDQRLIYHLQDFRKDAVTNVLQFLF